MPAAATRQRAGASGLIAFAFALIALGVSVYLTIEHYDSSVTLACPQSSTVNCVKVTTSQWSHVGPVPLALLGLIFFIAMTALCSPPAWRFAVLDPIRMAGAVVGVLAVLYLVWIELYKVDAICVWCTVVHVCSVGLLVAVLWRAASPADAVRE